MGMAVNIEAGRTRKERRTELKRCRRCTATWWCWWSNVQAEKRVILDSQEEGPEKLLVRFGLKNRVH